MPVDLCGNCSDPGMCCREIRLYSRNDRAFGDAATVLEAYVALATVVHADEWMFDTGLPFVPERRDPDGTWVMSCPRLTPEGRCGDYENRPRLCRTFTPGNDWPCAMRKTEPLPDASDPFERRAMGEERASRDRLTREQRSRLMSRIRGRDTGPELRLRAALNRLGIAYGTQAGNLPGRPDVVLRDIRLAVFVDGDFWHGWRFGAWKDTLSPFWREKISRNRLRDRRVGRELRAAGWTVLRFWERQVKADAHACARRIGQALKQAQNQTRDARHDA